MVFTVLTTALFFTHADQTGLTPELLIALQAEGLVLVDDLTEFVDDNWSTVTANLRNPASIPNPQHPALHIRP